MKIIISPAKLMQEYPEHIFTNTVPYFIEDTYKLYEEILKIDRASYESLFACSKEIADSTYQTYLNFNKDGQTSAIFSYTGIQYKTLNINSFDDEMVAYIKDNLFILSALYGVLKPFDKISKYRLDFDNNPLSFNLYKYWDSKVYDYLVKDCDFILNLASNEYSKLVKQYDVNKKIVDVYFYTRKNGKLKEISVVAKKARGAFVRYCASIKATSLKDLYNFNELGFKVDIQNCTNNKLIFINEV